jgi:O-antigen/teichoic acid export membrane protein
VTDKTHIKRDEIVVDDQSGTVATPIATAAGVQEPSPRDRGFLKIHADEIKGRSVRGGLVTVTAQGLKFVLNTGSSMILARLLTHADFGLLGMVVVVTGFLGLFSDLGLSMATIQRDVITHAQISTLFWINVAVGATLALLVSALAPVLVAFYHEPRLFWMTIALATTFLIGSFGAQHSALLMRSMRFTARAKIEIAALVVSVVVGVSMAALGCAYWSLVGMTISGGLVGTVGLWLAVRWFPGLPRRGCGLRSMFHFGGIVTLNNLVVYIGYNAEKILLGRYSGADVLGLYGRGYSLVNLPTTQLHAAMFNVAFPALSRLQSDPPRLRNAFLKAYSMVLSMTIPATIACVLFAEEVVRIVLGPKWLGAIPIFRLLAPTVLVFGLINPFGWFLTAGGWVVRSLKIALLIAPSVILGIALGLRYGPPNGVGVAMGYSTVMMLLAFPVIAWSKHGTGITWGSLWNAMKQPVLSGLVAAAAGLAFKVALGGKLPAFVCVTLGLGVTFGVYAWMLLIVMGQKPIYADLLRQVFERFRAKKEGDKSA